MSRKKPKAVDVVNHLDSGVEVQIYMQPDDLSFFAKLPDGEMLFDKNGGTLKNKVYSWLDENMKLEWRDVIEVKVLKPFYDNDNNFVGFEISRFHWAKKLVGNEKYVRADWGKRPGDQENLFGRIEECGYRYVTGLHFYQEKFNPPCFNGNKHDAGAYYIPYSEEIWIGLEQMLKAIREIKLRLNEMLADPQQGHAYLAVIGANILRALPAPAKREEDDD